MFFDSSGSTIYVHEETLSREKSNALVKELLWAFHLNEFLQTAQNYQSLYISLISVSSEGEVAAAAASDTAEEF